MTTSDDAGDFPLVWGRTLLEPTRAHIREPPAGGAVVGLALCGALLIDDLALDVAAGKFAKCTVCLERLGGIG